MTVGRVGVVRGHAGLPTIERQKEVLTYGGACAQTVELEPGPAGDRRLDRLIRTLRAGSELCVVSLDVFQRAYPELLRMMRDLAELRVPLTIVSLRDGEVAIPPQPAVIELLRQLSAYNGRPENPRPESTRWYGRPSRAADQFTRAQAVHARKLYGEGMSLRAIGLIFESSPEEVWKVVC